MNLPVNASRVACWDEPTATGVGPAYGNSAAKMTVQNEGTTTAVTAAGEGGGQDGGGLRDWGGGGAEVGGGAEGWRGRGWVGWWRRGGGGVGGGGGGMLDLLPAH